MRLALAEMRRRRGRWIAIMSAVGFIVFLVLVLAALADGLFNGNTGALQNSRADALVFSEDGRRSLIRSELPLSDVSAVAAVDGVADAGTLGVLLTTAGAPDRPFDVAVMGHTPGHAGEPLELVAGRRPATGEAFVGLADTSLREEGIALGDRVTITGSSLPVEVVGFVADAQYLLAGTLWVPLETWQVLRSEVRPETIGRGLVVQAFPIEFEDGVDPESVATAIDRTMETTETVSIETAMLSIPGVDQQRTTFTAIIAVSFGVVAIVTALFFALITLEKRGQLAILKAIGSPNPLLLGGILVQALIAAAAGFMLGFALSRFVAMVLPARVPIEFLPQTGFFVLVATLGMGAIGAALSFRRIIRIDPASALGGDL